MKLTGKKRFWTGAAMLALGAILVGGLIFSVGSVGFIIVLMSTVVSLSLTGLFIGGMRLITKE